MFIINRGRLVDLFCELARIKSPSGKEERISKVMISKLQKLGLDVNQDNYGNIIAKLSGIGKPIIICAHLDTVSIGGGSEIKPIVKKDTITSDGNTILGADNKDSLAAIIEMLTILSEEKLQHRTLEVVFTREEEAISKGAKHLDLSLLNGKECIISDLATGYGTIVVSARYCFRFDIKVIGKRSHAKEPEKGVNVIAIAAKAINKMPLGRIDDLTTSNIAYQVSGLKGVVDDSDRVIGSLIKENRNTVPDFAVVFGEVRGAKIDKVQETLSKIQEVFCAITKAIDGKIEFDTKKLADGYYFEENDPLVSMVSNIFLAQGITPQLYHSVGGSDANIFNNRGIHTVVISSAHRNSHKYTEYL